MHLHIAMSPDPDDRFMVWALQSGRLPTGPYRFTFEAAPTDALNLIASRGGADVCAISMAHYPKIAAEYQLLPHGGSLGEGYGPVVVAPQPMSLADLHGRRVGIPGTSTTAWAVLRMMAEVEPVHTPISPYHLIFDAIAEGRVDAGLLIHEGRLTYADHGLHLVADLGVWWREHVGPLPLPLGGNVIRRSLGPQVIRDVSSLLRQSIALALEHQDEAIAWLHSQGIALGSSDDVRHYLSLYANARTLDYGDDGRKGIEVFFERAAQAGVLPPAPIDYAP